jgi:hypothetical protein
MTPKCLILFIESIPDNIVLLSSLIHLDISNNNISGTINDNEILIIIFITLTCLILSTELDNIKLFKSLTHLDLSHNNLSGMINIDNDNYFIKIYTYNSSCLIF